MANSKSLTSNFQSLISNLQFLISGDTLAILFLIIFPFIYFWQVSLGQGVWLTTDILRLFYPFGVELARALNEGRLPLWTPNLLAGFPLLAEGQVGALYPINLLLYKFFPAHHALSFCILLHIVWAASGMYVFARARGIGVAGAWLAGFVFSFNGVIFGQMFHPPILFAVAWLPWLICLVAQFQTTRGKARAIWFALAALALGVQFLCGSVQMAFLNALAVAVFGVFGGWVWMARRLETASTKAPSLPSQTQSQPTKVGFAYLLPRLESPLQTILLLALGGGIAAIQLIPTSELIGYSVRGGTLGKEFVTSYSMPPEYLAQFVLPFAQGEPAEGNEEYRAYLGIAPLMLALAALVLRRNRQTIFFAAFALVALSLALGEVNPLYQLLYYLPLFNFFRVPARYLYLFVFAAAFLGAVGVQSLMSLRGVSFATKQSPTSNAAIASQKPLAMIQDALALLVLVVLILGAMALAYTQPLAFWLDAWRVLPIWLALFAIGMIVLACTRKIARSTFAVAIVGLTILDLASYAPPFLKTMDVLTPATGVTALPRSVQALGDALARGRVFADDSTFPSPPAIRNSLFPNTALLYDKASAQVYSSLAFGRHEAYVYNASPAMLNLLKVGYVMIPLEPRPLSKSAMPTDSLGIDVLRGEVVMEPTDARAIQIASATEQAANLASGMPIAEIVLRLDDGTTQVLLLRVGVDTADWDYERKRADNAIAHVPAPIAHSFPAYWRAFGRAFEGHTYLARYDLAAVPPRQVVGVSVRVLQSDAHLIIESIAFETKDQTLSLARLIGKNTFALAYMSDTVAAWENRDALPRAFVVHVAQVLDDDAAFARLHDPAFEPAREVLLAEVEPANHSPRSGAEWGGGSVNLSPRLGSPDQVTIVQDKPERVRINVTTDQPGYLVLTDSWYPGWRAFVDGQPAPIYRADVLFRAIQIEPGTHAIAFEYRPDSFLVGAMVSAAILVILVVYVGMSIGRTG